MWNSFNRPQETKVAPPEPRATEPAPAAGAGTRHSHLAEIELMGSTAVATFTVTELSQDESVGRLMGLLDELRELGAKHYVLDIQNVQHMDSACLGCLVEALNKMAKTGGRIALANTDNRVEYLFRLTRLDRVFPICHDVISAIETVEREPGTEDD